MRHRGHSGKVDANHARIVSALRRVGCRVLSLAPLGDGAPDTLVALGNKIYLFEIKAPGGELTDDEREWHQLWEGYVTIIRSVDEALAAVGVGVAER